MIPKALTGGCCTMQGRNKKWTFIVGYSGSYALAQSSTITSNSQLGHNTWMHMVGRSNSGTPTISQNGLAISTTQNTGSGTYQASVNNVSISKSASFSNNSVWGGLLDEIRISSIARSDAWIATEYNNQSSPDTFYSVGGAASSGGVSAPTFSPKAGSYTSAQSVTINTTTSGAAIRYTTDGSTPTETAGTLYSGPITVSTNLIIKAIAYKTGLTDSAVTLATYTLPPVARPTFSPGAGTYTSAQSVTITTTTSGALIRYTTDGSTPSETAGTLYSGAITVSATTTIKAIAYASGLTDSAVASAAYTINTSGWYGSEWSGRKQITINHGQVSGSSHLTNFPVLVSLPSDGNLQASAQSNGNDILFTAGGYAVTKLNHEIETYVSSTGQLAAWVQIPALSLRRTRRSTCISATRRLQISKSATSVWDSNLLSSRVALCEFRWGGGIK